MFPFSRVNITEFTYTQIFLAKLSGFVLATTVLIIVKVSEAVKFTICCTSTVCYRSAISSIVKTYIVKMFIWLRIGTYGGLCECGDELSGSIKCGVILD
jgi:hypothetical protein